MTAEGLEHYSKDQLIEELINRQTFAGIVVFHREDAKAGRLNPGEIVLTTSPPLSRAGVENLLRIGQSLVGGMFDSKTASAEHSPVEVLALGAETPPLRLDDSGAVRVGNSRISLDLIVEQYQNGLTPEDMVRLYDTLALADVYAVIAYYLRHREQVTAFLKRRVDEAQALRAKVEAEQPRVTRDELLARRVAAETDHAPTGR